MQPHAAERRHLERQIAYARPIFMVLALVDLLDRPPVERGPHAVLFVTVYLVVSLILALTAKSAVGWRVADSRCPLDLAALAVFLVLTRSVVAFWFVYLFVALASGIRWGTRRSVMLAGVVTLALLVRTAMNGPLAWEQMVSWIALAAGTFAAGAGMAFLGSRQRRHATEQEFLAQLTGLLEVDRGMAESLRLVLGELVRAFDCDEAILAFRDTDLERIFVWRAACRRQFASYAGKSSRDSQRRLPARPARRQRLLESSGGGRRWVRLESERWTPAEGFAAPARPHAQGARLALGPGGHA